MSFTFLLIPLLTKFVGFAFWKYKSCSVCLAFYMWWNRLIWFCFYGEKCQNKTKKMQCSEKSFTSYLHNSTTSEHNSTRSGELQCKATSFVFLTIFSNWSCDHPPNNLLDGPSQAKSSLSCFSSLFHQIRWNFLLWIYTVDPENCTWHAIHHSYFVIFWLFLEQWNLLALRIK